LSFWNLSSSGDERDAGFRKKDCAFILHLHPTGPGIKL
jgi:hypothetical protein